MYTVFFTVEFHLFVNIFTLFPKKWGILVYLFVGLNSIKNACFLLTPLSYAAFVFSRARVFQIDSNTDTTRDFENNVCTEKT